MADVIMTAYENGFLTQKSKQLADFSRACRAVWSSPERMMWDLAEYGLEVSKGACESYRAGKTEPRLTLGLAILDIIDLKTSDVIAEARERQDAVRRIKRHAR